MPAATVMISSHGTLALTPSKRSHAKTTKQVSQADTSIGRHRQAAIDPQPAHTGRSSSSPLSLPQSKGDPTLTRRGRIRNSHGSALTVRRSRRLDGRVRVVQQPGRTPRALSETGRPWNFGTTGRPSVDGGGWSSPSWRSAWAQPRSSPGRRRLNTLHRPDCSWPPVTRTRPRPTRVGCSPPNEWSPTPTSCPSRASSPTRSPRTSAATLTRPRSAARSAPRWCPTPSTSRSRRSTPIRCERVTLRRPTPKSSVTSSPPSRRPPARRTP